MKRNKIQFLEGLVKRNKICGLVGDEKSWVQWCLLPDFTFGSWVHGRSNWTLEDIGKIRTVAEESFRPVAKESELGTLLVIVLYGPLDYDNL